MGVGGKEVRCIGGGGDVGGLGEKGLKLDWDLKGEDRLEVGGYRGEEYGGVGCWGEG